MVALRCESKILTYINADDTSPPPLTPVSHILGAHLTKLSIAFIFSMSYPPALRPGV